MGRARTEESIFLDEQIIRYYTDGWKIQRIAEELNLSAPAIEKRLAKIRKSQGLARRNNCATLGGFNGFSDEELLRYFSEGLSPEEISEKFNATPIVIFARLHRLMPNSIFVPKTDCFAYSSGDCEALNELYCAKRNKCSFYRKRGDA